MKSDGERMARRRLEARGAAPLVFAGKQGDLRSALRRLEAGQRELFRRAFDIVPARAGTMEAWTPELTSTGTLPDIGASGVAVGSGKLIDGWFFFQLSITFAGAGMAAGTGNYRIIGLPYAPVADRPTWKTGAGTLTSGTTGNIAELPVIMSDVPELYFRYPAAFPSGAATQVGAATPWPWGVANDRIEIVGSYPVS